MGSPTTCRRVLKIFLISSLVIILLTIFTFRHLVTFSYLAKGYGYESAKEMGLHADILASSNINNISLYVKEFWESPILRLHPIPKSFFGLNVAPPSNPNDDEYLISDLKELGVETIRVDYGYGYDGISLERIDLFLDKAAAKFDILLHIAQNPENASRMSEVEEGKRWEEFIERVFSRHHGHIRNVEIGSMPNRRRWSGYSIPDYLSAVRIAYRVGERYGISIFAPNIQDFEPFWQIAFLSAMEKEGIKLGASTDNLFIDRAVQPEFNDTHVMGERLADRVGMDLINKTRFLDLISERFGVDRVICSYTQWNLDLPAPFYFASGERLATPERYADYLVRYYLLAMAGGYIDGVYWGEYASYKEGLLDDGFNPQRTEAPQPDAHHKFIGKGNIRLYKKRSAYNSYKTLVSTLSESRFIRKIEEMGEGIYQLQFQKEGRDIFVLWTLDGEGQLYRDNNFNDCRGVGRDGDSLDILKGVEVSGSPTYVICGNGK